MPGYGSSRMTSNGVMLLVSVILVTIRTIPGHSVCPHCGIADQFCCDKARCIPKLNHENCNGVTNGECIQGRCIKRCNDSKACGVIDMTCCNILICQKKATCEQIIHGFNHSWILTIGNCDHTGRCDLKDAPDDALNNSPKHVDVSPMGLLITFSSTLFLIDHN